MRYENSDVQQRAGTPHLERFPVIRSRSVDEAEHGLVTVFGARHFDHKGDKKKFFIHANYRQFGDISLSYCACGSPVEIGFSDAQFARQVFCLSGSMSITIGKDEARAKVDDSISIPAHRALRVLFHDYFQHVVLRISDRALVKTLTGLLGEEPAAPPKIFAAHDTSPATKVLRRLVLFTAQKLDTLSDDLECSPVVQELKQHIILSFLFSNFSDFSARLQAKPKDVAPWQVRAVEEYISANWDKSIDIAKLASVIGASASSIFQSFARARGYSPMAFLKQTRLVQARSRLLTGNEETSVTAVAFECCFHSLGYFARDYNAAFGELPSETLSRARCR